MALVSAYYVVGRDLSYMKGQLSIVMIDLAKKIAALEEISKALQGLGLAQAKAERDLNHAFDKIRRLEKGETNGHADNA